MCYIKRVRQIKGENKMDAKKKLIRWRDSIESLHELSSIEEFSYDGYVGYQAFSSWCDKVKDYNVMVGDYRSRSFDDVCNYR